MNFEQLSDLWDIDCLIDEDHLDRSSVKTAQLHSKYLRILVNHKMKFSALETEYKVLRQKKFKYYRGEMTKQEYQDRKKAAEPFDSDTFLLRAALAI